MEKTEKHVLFLAYNCESNFSITYRRQLWTDKLTITFGDLLQFIVRRNNILYFFHFD